MSKPSITNNYRHDLRKGCKFLINWHFLFVWDNNAYWCTNYFQLITESFIGFMGDSYWERFKGQNSPDGQITCFRWRTSITASCVPNPITTMNAALQRQDINLSRPSIIEDHQYIIRGSIQDLHSHHQTIEMNTYTVVSISNASLIL